MVGAEFAAAVVPFLKYGGLFLGITGLVWGLYKLVSEGGGQDEAMKRLDERAKAYEEHLKNQTRLRESRADRLKRLSAILHDPNRH